MDKLDYHVQLKVNTAAEQAINAISNVPGWWAQEVDGEAKKREMSLQFISAKPGGSSAWQNLVTTASYG